MRDLKQNRGACEEVIGQLNITLRSSEWQAIGRKIYDTVRGIRSPSALKSVIQEINATFAGDGSDEEKFRAVSPLLAEVAEANAKSFTYAERLTEAADMATRLESALLSRPEVADGLATAFGAGGGYALSRVSPGGNGAINHLIPADGVWVPSTVSFDFCVPANPTLKALRLRAEFNLYKINNCRNIAGMRRQIEFYAAPTDPLSGMPVVGGGGRLILPGTTQPTATAYRYAVLIERARQLVQQAMQIEAAFLAALEKSDKEAYDLLTARSNVRLAQAGVRLQDLRLLEAQDGEKTAELQRDREELKARTYEEWLNEGKTAYEEALLAKFDQMAIFDILATNFAALAQGITGSIPIATASALSFGGAAGLLVAFNVANAGSAISRSLAINAQREISRLNVEISFEQRMREWKLQQSIADVDVRISEQQIVLAKDRVRITEQERAIEQLRADQAKEVLDFLSNKFTNKELYDWMSDVLQDVYSVLLQQATSVAKLAAGQLAFERQEPPPPYIRDDYWEAPADASAGSGDGRQPDRRGLTGSARLLQDIAQLDQYAFEKNQRKQQLSKTISLAQHDPLAFQQFIQTGILPFTTSLELFDRDFPGHYLRLIKRVRTSVIALIPPAAGIRATLTASGLSRVVIGGDVFQMIVVRRAPESVALSVPVNTAGVSELQEQPEMLLPFESQGVAMSWEFSLPKAANQFDFSTIADVQVVIDYTALASFDYQQQVVQMLNAKRTLSAERAFSFRYQFADAWYEMHHPDLTSSPMSVGFETVREDFPPNVENVRIEHVTLYFSRKAGRNIEFETVDLRLTPAGGGVLGGIGRTDDGVISTRSGNGGGWAGLRDAGPFGRWQLTLPDTEQARQWFNDEDVTDILLVITYAGRLPEWPV